MPGAGMNFELTDDQELIRKSVAELAGKFDDHYWMEKDQAHEFPTEFYRAIADGGWLGMTMPDEYGGHGLGITEATILLEEVAKSGGAMNGASSIHLSIFGMQPVVVHGSEELKARTLPRVATGDLHVCFGVTEPGAGLDTIAHHHLRQARRRSLRRQRPQGVDLQGDGIRQNPAADPHHEVTTKSPRRPTG